MKTAPAGLALLFVALTALPGRAAPPPATGADFQVNVVAEGTQEFPAVAQDTAGDSVVAWLDEKGSPALVKVRLFDAAGTPAGGEIVVASLAPPLAYAPRVAMTPLGAFAVVWLDQQGVFLRRFDRLGRPDGEAVHLQQTANDVTISSPSVALDADGNAFVAWAVAGPQGGVIVLERLDAANHPPGTLGAAEVVNQLPNGLRGLARVAVGPAASADNVLVSWDDERSGQPEVWARRFDGASGTWAPEARISTGPTVLRSGGCPLLDAHGAGAVVFTDLIKNTVRVRRLDAGGVPFPTDLALSAAADPPVGEPAAAVTPDGTALVVWTGDDTVLHAAFFDGAWQRLGPDFTAGSQPFDAQSQPAVAAGGAGSLLLAWAEGGPSFPFEPPVIPTGRDGSGLGIFAQRFQSPACAAGSEHLCLGQIRGDGSQLFDVQVSWRNPYTGETGTGKSRPLTADTGAFWFFDPANLEVMIKILDGRPVNGYFWVFYGSLSNVEYTITVTETLTGAVKTYHNAPLQFASQADVQAFILVSAAAPIPAASAAAAPRPSVPPASFAAASFAAGDCTPTPTTLCPQNRFRAAVSFVDPRTGVSGQGQAVTLSGDTGIFWFFDPTNLELMVKVLDGNVINGRFWVFYGGLSDVDYTLTVTDTATGAQRIYHNPRHHLASAADLDAFPAGPTVGN